MMIRSLLCISLLASSMMAAQQSEQQSVLAMVEQVSPTELQQVKKLAQTGNLQATMQLGIIELARKNLSEALFWLGVLNLRTQLESISDPELLTKVQGATTAMISVVVMELVQQDPAFEKEMQEYFTEENTIGFLKRAYAQVSKEEMRRPADQYTKERKQV